MDALHSTRVRVAGILQDIPIEPAIVVIRHLTVYATWGKVVHFIVLCVPLDGVPYRLCAS